MGDSEKSNEPTFSLDDVHTDTWVWGRERILWGYAPSHQYTLKVLEPKKGREGMLSLQYHHAKSETWIAVRGIAWALLAYDDVVCTRILRPGDVQVIAPQMVHRLGAVTDDVQVVEPSTPDAHAADKSVAKDVVRLHCVFGRAVVAPRSEQEARIVQESVRLTDEALEAIARGEIPPQRRVECLKGRGAHRLW